MDAHDRSALVSPQPLDEVLDRIEPKIKSILGRYRIPAQDGEDLVQQALLAFVYKRDSIREPESWILGAVKKRCLMYWRRHRRRLYSAVDTALLDLMAEPQVPEQQHTEVRHDLDNAISRLSARCRSLLRLRYHMGYEPTEVAERLGYRSSSIRKVTTRCLAALTRQMVASGFCKEAPRA